MPTLARVNTEKNSSSIAKEHYVNTIKNNHQLVMVGVIAWKKVIHISLIK